MAFGILRNAFVALSMSVLLAACGGGSGGDSSSASLTPPGDQTPSNTNPPVGDGATPPADAETPPGDTGTAPPADQETPPTGGGAIPVPVSRSATVTWDAPTAKTDGSCLSELDSYRISYGLASGVYGHSELLDAAELSCTDSGASTACGKVVTCSYMVDELDTASWYFAVQAIDTAGNESDYSNEAVKTIQ